MVDRIAFRMVLNPGQAAEYERRHSEVYPELLRLLKESGVSDYSIWLDPEDHHLFGILTRSEANTLDRLPENEIVKRWWAFMSDIMESHPDNSPVQVPLKMVFHMP